jgi:hypothetical protein
MEEGELIKSQQEFLGKVLESSGRLASSWANLLKKKDAFDPVAGYEGSLSFWGYPHLFGRLVNPSFLPGIFQELAIIAAKELPKLIERRNDPKKLDALAQRWKRSNEMAIKKAFGLPAPSQTERLLRQWNTLLSASSSQTSPAVSKGPFGDFQRFMEAFTAPLGFGLPGSVVRVWSEAYGKSLRSAMGATDPFDLGQYGEPIREAIDAQKRFLEGIPQFQQQITSSAGKVTEAVVEAVGNAGIREVTGETYGRMLAEWLSKYEEFFGRLFGSEAFGRALAEIFDRGREVAQSVDSLMFEWLTILKLPTRRDTDEIQRNLESLSERIQALEDRVASMSERLEESFRMWDSRSENLESGPLRSSDHPGKS